MQTVKMFKTIQQDSSIAVRRHQFTPAYASPRTIKFSICTYFYYVNLSGVLVCEKGGCKILLPCPSSKFNVPFLSLALTAHLCFSDQKDFVRTAYYSTQG